MKPETKRMLRNIADVLVMFRVGSILFAIWCCMMFKWIVHHVMTNFDSSNEWVLAFYSTTIATFVPLMFKVFNDLRDSYQRDSRDSESHGDSLDK